MLKSIRVLSPTLSPRLGGTSVFSSVSTTRYYSTTTNSNNNNFNDTFKQEQKQQQEQQQQKQQNSDHNNNQGEQPKKKSSFKKTLLLLSCTAAVGSYVYFKANGAEPRVEYLKRIPFRMTSNLWGKIANIKIPENLRKPIYMTYSKVFGVNVNEAEKPVEEYESMADFFSRRLKDEARLIDMKHDLVSPVDGTVIYYGKVDNNTLEQVKGLTYSLEDFLGQPEMAKLKGKNLYHLGIYLSPGDYHGIHSPIDWKIQERYHFPGYLFPVAKVAVDNIPGLFALNERVVLSGQWKHGFFSLTPVGASNVGSIVMDFDKELSTNNPKDQSNIRKEKSEYYHRSYSSPIPSERGSEVAFFKMGSTVILVFEVPQDKQFDFTIKPGQHLKLGEPVGDLK